MSRTVLWAFKLRLYLMKNRFLGFSASPKMQNSRPSIVYILSSKTVRATRTDVSNKQPPEPTALKKKKTPNNNNNTSQLYCASFFSGP